MKFKHIRHATSLLYYANITLLIDPVLADAKAYPPIPNTPNQQANPLIGLSTPLEELLSADVVLSTHIHNDHFDQTALATMPKSIPILGQPVDALFFSQNHFTTFIPVDNTFIYKDIEITRVNAQHGTGEIGKLMGHASGYILKAANEPTLYITGDTVYNDSIRTNIETYQPEILIMNAGSPQFLEGDPIVMSIKDIETTMAVAPKSTFIIIHLDTFNHCIETRAIIHKHFDTERLSSLSVSKFYVPEDNEVLVL